MGHRHFFNSLPMFESDHDQNRNHTHAEQPYMYLESISIDGVHVPSHWNPVTRSSSFSSSCHNIESPQYWPDVSGPSHDHPFLHPTVAERFCIAPENYYAQPRSSSSYERRTFQGIDAGFVDHTIADGRGSYKRKNLVCEGGSSTSRYYGGSSSDLSIPSECLDEPNTDCQHSFWDPMFMAPGYNIANALPIGGEGSLRNVRSRSTLDLESNLDSSQLSSNAFPHPYNASCPIDHHNSVDLSSQTSTALEEWSHVHAVPPVHWRAPISETIGLRRETNHYLVGINTGNSSVDIGGHHHDFSSSRNPVQQNSLCSSFQCVRGVRSSYSQTPSQTFRASSSNFSTGRFGMSDDGLPLVAAENFSSRSSRPLPVVGWQNSERSGRSRISSERYRPFSDEASVRGQLASEAIMYIDYSSLSRNLFDQHRDMRLDIDNMSYEELLALSDRIGNVSTGLPEDVISKCLTETRYCSLEQIQEGRCVICLEEYNNSDRVGKLKICGHDYHVGCIGKWLSMKNTCPICKASAMAENIKEK